MNCHLLNKIGRVLSILVASSFLISCDHTSPELIEAEKVVQGAPVEILGRHSISKEPFVYLIGENHASVANQLELAELLTTLHREAGLKTILVEGSNGAFPLDQIRTDLDFGNNDQSKLHWQEQMEWGRIAGYEFVALTTSDIIVHGVEDMMAKQLYGIDSSEYGSRNLQMEIESYQLGAQRLREAFELIAKKSTHPEKEVLESSDIVELQTAISKYELSISDYDKTLQNYSEAKRASRNRAKKYAQLYREAEPVYKRYGNDLAEIKELQKEIQRKEEGLIHQQKEYERKVAQYNRSISSSRPANPPFDDNILLSEQLESLKKLQDLTNSDRSLLRNLFVPTREEIQRIESNLLRDADSFKKLKDKFALFITNEYPKTKALHDFQNKPLTTEEKKTIETAVASANEATAKLEDTYFDAANRIQTIGSPLGIDLSTTQTFWFDRVEWISTRRLATAEDGLRDRDIAMAKNSRTILDEHHLKIAAVIVGYAHLPGMEKQLRKRDIGFMSMRLRSSNMKIEPWEENSWKARQAAGGDNIYTAEKTKEVGLLANIKWGTSEVSRFRLFERIQTPNSEPTPSIRGLVGDGRVYEGKLGSDRVILTSQVPFNRNAQVGDHVLDQGPMPTHQGKYYQIIDRKRAREQVQKLSDSSTSFTYAYQTTASGAKSYEIVTPSGKTSVQEFRNNLPRTADGSVPKRVVMFREFDEIDRGGVVISPLLDRLRMSEFPVVKKPLNNDIKVESAIELPSQSLASGGDGIKPPNNAGPVATAPGEPPPGFGSNLGGGKREERSGAGQGSNTSGGGKNRNTSAKSGNSGYFWSHPWLAGMYDNTGSGVRLYQTINPKRAKRNLNTLDRQAGRDLGRIDFLDEQGLESLSFTPRDGQHARTVVFHAENTPEFRRQVAQAAALGKLRNKQVALITCGDSFVETTALREAILEGGAIMVWVPERQLNLKQGRTLYEHIQKSVEKAGDKARTQPIDRLMMDALQRWQNENPDDAAIRIFEQSGIWVHLKSIENEFVETETNTYS